MRASLAPLRISPLVALIVSGCVADARDWAFVQSVGGMALGLPYRTASGVMLPVSVDVSGQKAITAKPTTINSALVVKEVLLRRDDNTLALTLVTTLSGKASQGPTSKDLPLGQLKPGRYTIVYAEPDGKRVGMGEITVPP